MADWTADQVTRTAEQPATWLTVDPRGNPSDRRKAGPLSLAAPRAVGRRICVLVPGTDVLLAEPEVPMKAGTKLQQVVRLLSKSSWLMTSMTCTLPSASVQRTLPGRRFAGRAALAHGRMVDVV